VVTDSQKSAPLADAGYETPASAIARANAQEHAWNTVWWRRIVYFLSVIVASYLIIYPLARVLPRADEFSSPFVGCPTC